MAPRAGPIAAEIIYLDGSVMLFMPPGQDPGADFIAAAEEIFGLPEDIRGKFPGAYDARQHRHFLELVYAGVISRRQLEQLRERHGVMAVVKGDPFEFHALVHTAEEKQPSRLLSELGSW
jgi:hypothetical protein